MESFYNETYNSLTPKQQKAIDIYVENGFKISDAAKKAGYSYKKLEEWLRTEKAKVCLKAYTLFLLGEKKDTLEYQIIDTYITRAFYNPADIIDANGHLVVDDLKKLGRLSVCVDGIEKEVKKDGYKLKIKLCDREKAMEQLARYIQIMTDKVELTGKGGGPLTVWSLSKGERKKRIQELLKKGGIGK